MLYHTPFFNLFVFFCLFESMLLSSAAACSVHPVPLCMFMQNYFLCPTLCDIPGCHLTLYDAPHTYCKAFARGCRWFSVCVYASRSAGRIFVFITHTLAGCNDCFYLFSRQSRIVWFFRQLLQMLTSFTSVIFLLVFHLVKIRLCAGGYASCNCLHYQL